MSANLTVPENKRRLIRRLIGEYMRPYIRPLCVATFFMIVSAAMTAAFAQLVQPVLDDVLYAKKEDMVLLVAGLMAGVFVVRGITTYIHTVMMSRIGEWIIGDLQQNLFERFMKLDLAFHHAYPSSQLLSRIVNDVQMVRFAITDTMTGFGKNVVTLVLLLAVMMFQDWKLSCAALTLFPVAVFFVASMGRRLRKVSRRIQEEMGTLTERLSQILQGIRLVKSFGQEDRESGRANDSIVKVRTLMVKSVKIGNLSTPVNEILLGLTVFGIIVYGGYQVADGGMTPGTLISFITAFTLAYEPMKKLAKLNNSLQMGLGAAERVFDMIDEKVQITDSAQAKDIRFTQPEITFEKVSFSYEDEEGIVLEDVNFTAPGGKMTALVGPSGAGKSTIFNLLLRFYDVKGGSIRFNDTQIQDITIGALRKNIAFVSQDITIFNMSARDNIAYGLDGASDMQVEEAAKKAAAHDFIMKLPQGYDTILGEDGTKLSGGQRQRISLARAIIRDAPILLLDEATSALDTETEQLIQKALADFGQGRTTLVIAHRLSTVRNADRIVVMERGRVVETGSHASLQSDGGLYARMVSLMERESA